MGLLSKLMKAGVAKKAIDIGRREASKPENQQKARELFAKMRNRRRSN